MPTHVRTYYQPSLGLESPAVTLERAKLRILRDDIARDLAGKQRRRSALARAEEMELKQEMRGELRARR